MKLTKLTYEKVADGWSKEVGQAEDASDFAKVVEVVADANPGKLVVGTTKNDVPQGIDVFDV